MNGTGSGKIKVTNFMMRQFTKKYFDSYSEAEIWLANTTVTNDGEIRQEAGGKYYIFIDEEVKKQS